MSIQFGFNRFMSLKNNFRVRIRTMTARVIVKYEKIKVKGNPINGVI